MTYVGRRPERVSIAPQKYAEGKLILRGYSPQQLTEISEQFPEMDVKDFLPTTTIGRGVKMGFEGAVQARGYRGEYQYTVSGSYCTRVEP